MRIVDAVMARPRLRLGLALCVLLAHSSACGDRDAPLRGPVERDSAGVWIVDNPEPQWSAASPWQTGLAITIGSAVGGIEDQLHRVAGAVRASDGTIVIANAGSGEIRVFDSNGNHVRSHGGAGSGPGEFRQLGWIGRAVDDTLFAWDGALNRMTVLTAAAGRIRDFQPQLPETPRSQIVRGILSGGRVVLSRGASFVSAQGEPGLQRQPVTAWVIGPTGAFLGEIGSFPGEQVMLRAGNTPGSTIRTPVPFGVSTLIATGGNRIYVVDNVGYEVRVHHDDGELERIIRRPHQPQRVSPEDLAAYLEERLAAVPPVEEIRAGIRAAIEAVPPPEFMPAVRSIHVDRQGYLWLEASRPTAAEAATWSIFDTGGRWLGDLELPADHELLDIGEDYILALGRDELGVETLNVLSLSRS